MSQNTEFLMEISGISVFECQLTFKKLNFCVIYESQTEGDSFVLRCASQPANADVFPAVVYLR